MVTRHHYDQGQSSEPHHRRRRPGRYSDESDTSEEVSPRQRRNAGRPLNRAPPHARDVDQRRSGRPRASVYPDDGPPPSSSQVRSLSPAIKPTSMSADSMKPYGPPRSRAASSVHLEDPARPRAQHQTRPRRRSKVRISTPSDSSADEGYGRKPKEKSARRTVGDSHKDLEQKNNIENIQFRERRDDYLSDEGETLRQARKGRPGVQDASVKEAGHGNVRPGSGDRTKTPGREMLDDELPYRPNSRIRSPDGLPHDHGHQGRSRVSRSRRPAPAPGYNEVGSETDEQRRHRINRSRHASRRAVYDDDDYDEPLRRRPGSHRRRDDRRGGAYPPEPDADREYISDFSRERRGSNYLPSRYERHERHAPSSRRNDRYRDYQSDHEDSRHRHGRRESVYDSRDFPEERYRDKYRESYRDDEYDRSHRGANGKDRGRSHSHGAFGVLPPGWQHDAGRLFMAYGLPYLQKEGPQLFKQAQTYWSKRASARGGRY